MSNGKPTILKTFYSATPTAGPYLLPAPGAAKWPDGTTKTSVFLRLTDKKDVDKYIYKTVVYLVGPDASSTSVTLDAATSYGILVDLPDGIATLLSDLDALFPASAAAGTITPLDGGTPPPPAPGTIHGGNYQ